MHRIYDVALVVNFFDSWRSLFFYMCTGIIQFAQLKSQGADVRARHVQEQTMPNKPPPCSPKVIYSLAEAVSYCVRMYCVLRLLSPPHSAQDLHSP